MSKRSSKKTKNIFKPTKTKIVFTLILFIVLAIITYTSIQESHFVLCGPLLTNDNLDSCSEIISQFSLQLTTLTILIPGLFYIIYSYLEKRR
ncbi:MAG: hypothetical protein ACE5ES_01305 [Candidatus Nanoarchaeia archaeon]